MINNYSYELSLNAGKNKKADDESTILVCAITEYAAKDLKAAIRRDIILREFNSHFTNKTLNELISPKKMADEQLTLKQIKAKYKKFEKEEKAKHKTIDMVYIPAEMQTKSILAYFGVMGEANKCNYIVMKLLQYETESFGTDKWVDEYKKQFVSYYMKMLEVYSQRG